MYCKYCGAELTDEALFCTECGQKVPSSTEGDGSETASDFEGAADASALKSESREDGAFGSNVSHEEHSSFKSAMDASKQRSRRKMPLIVLVVLVALLLSSVAYAAYWAYTTYIAPAVSNVEAVQQSEVEASTSEQAAEEDSYVDVWVVDTSYSVMNGVAQDDVRTYEYDDAGRLVRTTGREEFEVGQYWDKQELMTYDGNRLSAVEITCDAGSGPEYHGDYTYSYDEQGRCVERTDQMTGNGMTGNRVVYSYDDRGDATGSTTHSYGVMIQYVGDVVMSTASYSREGNVMTMASTSTGTGNASDSTISITYDENGRAVSSTRSYASDRSTDQVTQYAYDEHGNLISETTSYQLPTGEVQTYGVAYTYKQIRVNRNEFVPNEYTNPTGETESSVLPAPTEAQIDAIVGKVEDE